MLNTIVRWTRGASRGGPQKRKKNFMTQLFRHLIHVLTRWSMQINYVIVVLAERHVQQREGGGRRGKKKKERSYRLLARGEEKKATRTCSGTWDLFNYGAAELHWKHNFWVSASSVYTHTLLRWPDKLLLLSKHACQVAMKQSLMSTLLYLP